MDVLEVKNSDGRDMYLTEIHEENVAYVISGCIQYEEFLKIIQEIYLKNA